MEAHSLSHRYGSAPFLVSDAQAAGYTRGALRNRQLFRLYNGSRSLTPFGMSLRERALAYLPHMRPGDRFSHTTALALLGCPLFAPTNAPVDVESAPSSTPPRRKGVRGHSGSGASESLMLLVDRRSKEDLLSLDDAVVVPIAPPAQALLQAATQLPGSELVVAMDYLLQKDVSRCDPATQIHAESLTAVMESSCGTRGVRRFGIAAGLARVGAESRMETLTRLIAERAGVNWLTLQYVLHDQSGTFIGRFDLADEDSRSLFEYDGEQHRLNRQQYLRDLHRLDAARDAGWRPVLFHVEDVLRRQQATGQRMLLHTGRSGNRVPSTVRAFLNERHQVQTVPV